MKLGIGLPQAGVLVSPKNLVQVAQEAEQLGYDSVWVYEHLLRPIRPISDALGGPPVMQPELYRSVYEPLETLAYVAAKTERVQLGTSVVNALFQPPLILARRLATLDQLSSGRVIAGLGQGWMEDEFKAVNMPMKRRGGGMEEYIRVMQTVWGPDPVCFDGRFYTIPESQIGPKPVQPGGIPIILGGFAPAALERAARIADGINPGNFPWPAIEQIVFGFRHLATQAGRDASTLQIIMRVIDAPMPEGERLPLVGTIEEIRDDIQRLQAMNVDHIIFDLSQNETPIKEQLHFFEQLRAVVPV